MSVYGIVGLADVRINLLRQRCRDLVRSVYAVNQVLLLPRERCDRVLQVRHAALDTTKSLLESGNVLALVSELLVELVGLFPKFACFRFPITQGFLCVSAAFREVADSLRRLVLKQLDAICRFAQCGIGLVQKGVECPDKVTQHYRCGYGNNQQKGYDDVWGTAGWIPNSTGRSFVGGCIGVGNYDGTIAHEELKPSKVGGTTEFYSRRQRVCPLEFNES